MKVPTYQSQTLMTPKTGASSLSVQASPSNVAMGVAAQGDLFSQLQGTSFKFLEMETKMTRQSELAAAENALDLYMGNLTMAAAQDQNPNSMIKNWNAGTTKLFNSLSMKIDDPVVRRAFDTKAKDKIFSSRLSILKSARAKRIAIGLGNHTEKVYNLKKRAATGNAAEVAQAELELFGREATIDDFGNKVPAIPSMFERAFNAGLITKTKQIEQEIKAKGDIQGFEIHNDLSSAAVSGDPSQAEAIIRNLDNPAKYPDIFGKERTTLLNKAISLKESLQKDQIAKDNAATKANDKETKNRQRATEKDYILKIMESRNPSSDSSDSFMGPPEMPTIEQVQASFDKNDLTKTQFDGLVKKIKSGGVETSDARVVMELRSDIDDATSDAELETIRDEIDATYLQDGDPLSDADHLALINRINSKLGNTELDAKSKVQKNNLKLLLKIDDTGGFKSAYISDAKEHFGLQEAAIDALNTFDKGTDPEEAYKYVAGNWKATLFSDKEGQRFGNLALAPFTSNLIKGMGNPKDWNVDQISKLKKKIMDTPSLPPNAKVFEKETLDLLIEYKGQIANE